jgi:hypothetical protein
MPQAPLSRRLSASNEPSPPSQPNIGNNTFQQQPAPSFTARPVQQVQQQQRLPLSQSQPLPQKQQQQPLSQSQPLQQQHQQQQQQQEEKSTSLITAFSVKGSAPALGNGMALQYQKYDRAAGTTPVTASTSTTGASPSYALDNMSKRLHSSSSSSSSSNNSNVNISSSTANGNNDNSINNTTSNNNLSINTSADPSSRSREPSQSSLPNYMSPTKSSHRVRSKEAALSHTPSRPTTAPVASSNFSSSFGSSVSRAGGERVSSAGSRGTDRVMIGLGSRLDTSMRLNTTPGLFGGPAPYAAYDNEPKKQRGQKKRLKKLKGSAGTFQQQQQMQQQQQSSGRLNNRMGSSFGLGIGGVGLL